jgi:hypothetical protein
MAARRQQDASTLTFPIQMVVLITTTVLTVAGAVYGSQAGIRSDLRDIRTRMDIAAEANKELRDAEGRTVAAREAEARSRVDAVDKRLKLLELQFQQLQADVIKLQR